MTAGAVTAASHIRRLEFPLLCMFLVVPPLLEAPKNPALALFILIRFARAIAERRFGFQRPKAVELAVAQTRTNIESSKRISPVTGWHLWPMLPR